MATVDTLEKRLQNLEIQMKGLGTKLERLAAEVVGKASSGDLNRVEYILRDLITDHSTLITNIEKQLATVILPEETRFYLKENEVADFQANYNQLRAMMVSFEKLYKNLVAYSTKLRAQ